MYSHIKKYLKEQYDNYKEAGYLPISKCHVKMPGLLKFGFEAKRKNGSINNHLPLGRKRKRL